MAIFRTIPFMALILCVACGSSDNTTGKVNEAETLLSNSANNDAGNNSPSAGDRELVVSEETTIITVTQCFCSTLYRSTLQFYHFEENNAVLLIEFDNQTRDFNRTVRLMLFEATATSESIAKWINNQHSDGLYIDPAVPLATHDLVPDSVSITSSAFVERLFGELGDEYEETRIHFTLSNLSKPGSYFLNGFADQSVVYLQTK